MFFVCFLPSKLRYFPLHHFLPKWNVLDTSNVVHRASKMLFPNVFILCTADHFLTLGKGSVEKDEFAKASSESQIRSMEETSPEYCIHLLILQRYFIKNIFLVFIYLRERQRETKWRRGRERGRHRIQSRLQALSCQHRHRARCRAWTHKRWDHDLSWSQTPNWLSHPGAPP